MALTFESYSPTEEIFHYHKMYTPDLFINDYKGSFLNQLYEHDIHQQFDWQHPIDRRPTFPYLRHDHPYPSYEHHYPSYYHFEDPNIKIEDTPPLMVHRSPPSCHQMAMPSLLPHSNLPVQFTDDAASKETQHLRRRCFNCQTTEPPSWRRSTLNPGKIVCNKCGLYERTHLRARPLKFDQLRSGSKSRRLPKITTSPKQLKMAATHAGSGATDWDDNASLCSSVSALTRDSHSPPQDGIKLPKTPLSDVASISQPSTISPVPNPTLI